jgi:hypothetical protein
MLMPMTLRNSLLCIAAAAATILFVPSCTSDDDKNPDELAELSDSAFSTVLNIGGELFSIPSPIQTAMLVQKSGVSYDKSILIPTGNADAYTDNFSKSLALGMYGADLGYIALYNKTQDVLGYFATVKKLGDELGISGAFDAKTVEKIQGNLDKKDSLLNIVALAYRSSDQFLKDERRNEVASVILAGGWIESLYFSISALKQRNNEELRNRVAEQKTALSSIIKLLAIHSDKPEYEKLANDLSTLHEYFGYIKFKYVYAEPKTDAANKTTTLNSKTQIIMDNDAMNKISAKLIELRNKLIDPTAAAVAVAKGK